VIHVAGTKGKGTTCYYCSRILVEHQKITGNPKKVGCLTSPHKTDVRERILINNEKISKRLFSYYIQELDSKINSLTSRPDLETPLIPKYPGFLSLLAIYIFILEKVDVAILETGTGGETDSTNVFPHPVATGITSIGLDHVDVLGHTVEKIAWHKAGIFKPGSIAGTVPQDRAVLQVLRERAVERNVAGELQVITDQKVIQHGVKVDPDMRYQRHNAGLALFLAEAYLKSVDPRFSMTGDIARSLQDVELLGRSQILRDGDSTWFISSGVNEISLKEAVSWFKQSIRQSR
jgi:folylpolyglutamate synthase